MLRLSGFDACVCRGRKWPRVPKNTTDALVASYNSHDDPNTTNENDPNAPRTELLHVVTDKIR